MSAIFGILQFGDADVNAQDLDRLGNVLAHRGPDGRKFVIDGTVGLGHCLMRVNNEDLFEAQPLYDREADLSLVADCRIDNREELSVAFGWSDAECRDRPDSAFILAAYKKWGEAAPEHLLGDFAYAVWDRRANMLVLARDHMGQRCVHWYCGKDFFVFATEIGALWAVAGVPRELDEVCLGRFLLSDVTPNDGATVFKDIFGLTGGTVMTVSADGRVQTRRYWIPHAGAEHLGRDEPYYVANYRAILEEAVGCRIRRSIGSPALLLSAGYDSAAIAGLCGPPLKAKGQKLIAISSVLPEDRPSPRRDVRPWVEYCRRDMPHLDVRYFVRDPQTWLSVAKEAMRDDAALSIQPVLYEMFRMAAESGARVVMNGTGGDATLNPRHRGLLRSLILRGSFRQFLRELLATARLTGSPIWRTLWAELGMALVPRWAYRLQTYLYGYERRRAACFIAPRYFSRLRAVARLDLLPRSARYAASMARTRSRTILNRAASTASLYDTINAAIHGVDLTKPMFDKRVVEFGLAIPEELQLAGGLPRQLARQALADVYPREYQTRPSHQDPFDPDIAETARVVLPTIAEELSAWTGRDTVGAYLSIDDLMRAARDPEALRDAQAVQVLLAYRAARFIRRFRNRNA